MASNFYKGFLKLGRFLRVVDEKYEQVSIVNVACIVIVVKVAMTHDPSIAELSALLIGLLAHYGKRRINVSKEDMDGSQVKQLEETQSKLKELGDRVGSLAAAMGFKNLKQ